VVPGFGTSDADPELFLPIGNAGPALLQLDQAKQVWGAQSVRRAWSRPWPAARRPSYGEAPVSLSGALYDVCAVRLWTRNRHDSNDQ
jgi:hypothetical protein